MKLKDAINQWEREKHLWPDGYNFKNKSRFVGITNKDETIVLTQPLLDCDSWGFSFESHDKEFKNAVDVILKDKL